MFIAILNDYGYRDIDGKREKRGNIKLRRLSFFLVRQLLRAKSDNDIKTAFISYFMRFKVVIIKGFFPYLNNNVVRGYVWSYGVYMALLFDFEIDELEFIWRLIMKGDKNDLQKNFGYHARGRLFEEGYEGGNGAKGIIQRNERTEDSSENQTDID